jgi:hypothetical protein
MFSSRDSPTLILLCKESSAGISLLLSLASRSVLFFHMPSRLEDPVHLEDKPAIVVLQAVSFIHIDCEVYTGAVQALKLLSDRIHPGTVIIFDELINYPNYRSHEVKALWEWLQVSGRHVRPMGIMRWPEGEEGMALDPVSVTQVRSLPATNF